MSFTLTPDRKRSLAIGGVVAWGVSLVAAAIMGAGSARDRKVDRSERPDSGRSERTFVSALGVPGKNGAGSTVGGKKATQARKILRDSDRISRLNNVAEMASSMESEQFETLLRGLKDEMRGGNSVKELGLLLYGWAQKDGPAALKYLRSEADDSLWGYYYFEAAYRGWGESNPEEAIAWLEENGEQSNLLKVLGGVAKTDVSLAARIALNIENPRGRGRALDKVVYELFQQGQGAPLDWMKSISAGDGSFGSSEVVGRVAKQMAREEPSAAADWALTLEEGESNPAVAAVAREWARQEPREAAARALEIGDADLRGKYMESLIGVWADKDVNGAGRWLGEQAPSPELDRSVRTFALKIDDLNPVEAIVWAETIGDESLRVETVNAITDRWMRSKPEEFKEFLNNGDSSTSS